MRQPFFWSASGVKLFGRHPDLRIPAKLRLLLEEAVAKEPGILLAFLEETISGAEVTLSSVTLSSAERRAGIPGRGDERVADLAPFLSAGLHALLAHPTLCLPAPDSTSACAVQSFILHAVLSLSAGRPELCARSRHPHQYCHYCATYEYHIGWHAYKRCMHERFPECRCRYTACVSVLAEHPSSAPALTAYATSHLAPLLSTTDTDASAEATARRARREERRTGAVRRPEPGARVTLQQRTADLTAQCMTLVRLFVARPAEWSAWRALVPAAFDSLFALGKQPRTTLNELLTSDAFDPSLSFMVCTSDDFVKSRFFWNAEVHTVPSSRDEILARPPPAHRASLTSDSCLHLFSGMISAGDASLHPRAHRAEVFLAVQLRHPGLGRWGGGFPLECPPSHIPPISLPPPTLIHGQLENTSSVSALLSPLLRCGSTRASSRCSSASPPVGAASPQRSRGARARCSTSSTSPVTTCM